MELELDVMDTLKFSPVFAPVFVARTGRRRSKPFRALPAIAMALLTTLLMSTAAAADPDQVASLQVPVYGPAPHKDFDLQALEAKIRNTDAIDLFAKINLKFEISSLIDDVARSQASKNAADLARQRVRFEKLIDSTVDMLRKGDAALAAEVASSRAALWSFLNDPERRLTIAELDNDGQTE